MAQRIDSWEASVLRWTWCYWRHSGTVFIKNRKCRKMCYASNIPCVCLLICRVRAAVTTCHNNCMGTLFFSIRWHFVHSMNVTCVMLLSRKNWTITRITVAVLQHAVFWTAEDTLLCVVPSWINLWLSPVPQCAVLCKNDWFSCHYQWSWEKSILSNISTHVTLEKSTFMLYC